MGRVDSGWESEGKVDSFCIEESHEKCGDIKVERRGKC